MDYWRSNARFGQKAVFKTILEFCGIDQVLMEVRMLHALTVTAVFRIYVGDQIYILNNRDTTLIVVRGCWNCRSGTGVINPPFLLQNVLVFAKVGLIPVLGHYPVEYVMYYLLTSLLPFF